MAWQLARMAGSSLLVCSPHRCKRKPNDASSTCMNRKEEAQLEHRNAKKPVTNYEPAKVGQL